ncbi:hypothetical protein [Prolixibacter sp. SD074]|jgi:ABC-type lipoprotein export system ATPase subunit|uniref:hypothetical protein n=1 Tax=Prolixibacter sp. SD074 TaxID=2652391 RepID=UPI00128478C0|nr:hypothetical protein [Prolixibacter sp. SD074]GET30503.1 hypothetical protein SD074_27050 [Prolixibacter sp. SD074]
MISLKKIYKYYDNKYERTYILKKLNDEGMTIIQVTHNQEFAQYGKRIIRLVDGEVEEEIIRN